MELLPIIYNSLIIAAGLFVVTVAISFVSYKVKQRNGKLNNERTREEYPTIFRDKKRIEEELKPHSRLKPSKPVPSQHREKRVEKKEKPVEKPKEKLQPKQKQNKELPSRLERVTELLPPEKTPRPLKKDHPKPKSTVEDSKKKKNLKSIDDDDPLKKYTDSADDDLHPLKTDE